MKRKIKTPSLTLNIKLSDRIDLKSRETVSQFEDGDYIVYSKRFNNYADNRTVFDFWLYFKDHLSENEYERLNRFLQKIRPKLSLQDYNVFKEEIEKLRHKFS